MSTRTSKATASPFAHLAKGGADSDKDPDDKDGNGKAEGGQKEPKDTTGDGDNKPKDDAKSKRGKAKSHRADDDEDDEGDDDTDAEDEKDDDKAKARARERGRCAAIFSCSAAGRLPAVAAQLAFATTMSRSAAISVLEATAEAVPPAPASARGLSLRDRMAPEGIKPVPTEAASAGDGAQAKTPGARLVAALPASRR